jgi:hypothetical protein
MKPVPKLICFKESHLMRSCFGDQTQIRNVDGLLQARFIGCVKDGIERNLRQYFMDTEFMRIEDHYDAMERRSKGESNVSVFFATDGSKRWIFVSRYRKRHRIASLFLQTSSKMRTLFIGREKSDSKILHWKSIGHRTSQIYPTDFP